MFSGFVQSDVSYVRRQIGLLGKRLFVCGMFISEHDLEHKLLELCQAHLGLSERGYFWITESLDPTHLPMLLSKKEMSLTS